MPLGDFEREVLRLLAGQRSPDSYVAGATVLHQRPDSPRTSEDVDFFHDEEAAVGLFEKLPVTERGCLHLDAAGKPVRPDPAAPGLAQLTRHYGSVKGAWPRIVEE